METYQTAKAALQDSEGSFLLLRRSATHPKEALKMDLPGGIIDPGEQPAEALVREIKEETGLNIDISAFTLFYAEAETWHGRNAVRTVYIAKLSEPKVKITLSWEHDRYEWLPLEEALKALPEGRYTHRALQYFKDKDLVL